MPDHNDDLHGNAPDHSKVVLLLIDVINPFDFPEAGQLLEHAVPMARHLAKLKARARAAGVAVVYANDNFGRWRSDLNAVVERCRKPDCLGRPIAEALSPEPDDYFVLKPKHSAFFSTTLDTLLQYLDAQTLVLAGVAGNICVLFSANDAYMRDYHLLVPSDGTASNTREENDLALQQMERVLKADVRPCSVIDFDSLLGDAVKPKSRNRK